MRPSKELVKKVRLHCEEREWNCFLSLIATRPPCRDGRATQLAPLALRTTAHVRLTRACFHTSPTSSPCRRRSNQQQWMRSPPEIIPAATPDTDNPMSSKIPVIDRRRWLRSAVWGG